MPLHATIPKEKVSLVRNMYYEKKMTMQQVADKLNVSIDAVMYCMRKHKMKRRSLSEASAILFSNKPLSFSEKKNLNQKEKELKLAGLMLYLGEGGKSLNFPTVDLANSDPDIILIFCIFLRSIYRVDEKRLRVQLYCYADQNTASLISFWSTVTKIPKKQFIKPYVRHDFRIDGRKMKHGMVHIRYADKKLFLSIIEAIRVIKSEMTRRSDSGNSIAL